MLSMCIGSALFLALQLLVGAALIHRAPGNVSSWVPTDLLRAAWTGFAVILITSLAVAATGPVSPIRSFAVFSGLAAVAIVRLRMNHTRLPFRRCNSPWALLIISILGCCGIAATNAAVPTDTGLYHLPAVEWYSTHGIIDGLGLIHIRFAYVSSWFALGAVFNHGFLQSTPPAIPGVLAAVLLLLQLAIHLRALWTATDSWLDRGMVCVLLSIGWLTWVGRETFTSPDCGVTALIVAAYWMLAATSHAESETKYPSEVLVLAAAAATIKPTALLLLVFAASVVCVPRVLARDWGGLCRASAAAVAPVLLLCYANWRASGSMLFPSPSSLLTFTTPWTIPSGTTDLFAAVSREWNRRLLWTVDPSKSVHVFDWLGPWIKYYWPHVASAFGTACVITTAFWRHDLSPNGRRPGRPLALAALLGLIGTAYWFVLGAAPRLGIGYTVLPLVAVGVFASLRLFTLAAILFALLPLWPTLSSTGPGIAIIAIMIFGTWCVFFVPTMQWRYGNQKLTVLLIIAFLVLVTGRECAITLLSRIRAEGVAVALTIPPHYPIPSVHSFVSNNVRYVIPAAGDLCWAAPLPCTPYLTVRQIALRQPGQGISGGLMIADPGLPEGFLNANQLLTKK